MEDEIALLEGLYPECSITRGPGKSVSIVYEAYAKCGKVRLRVNLSNVDAYPAECRPTVIIERGLSVDVEKELVRKLDAECKKLDSDYCLVQLFGCFSEELSIMSVTCGICLDEVEDDVFVTAECAHVFHRSSCLSGWIDQCKQNRELHVETEQARIRRRQRERESESEHKLAQAKVVQLENERTNLLERRELLTAKLQGLSASKPASRKVLTKGEISERDKTDEDVTDPSEIERRVGILKSEIKANTAALAGARKQEQSTGQALEDVRTALAAAAETEEQESMMTVPCPVCRTAIIYS